MLVSIMFSSAYQVLSLFFLKVHMYGMECDLKINGYNLGISMDFSFGAYKVPSLFLNISRYFSITF